METKHKIAWEYVNRIRNEKESPYRKFYLKYVFNLSPHDIERIHGEDMDSLEKHFIDVLRMMIILSVIQEKRDYYHKNEPLQYEEYRKVYDPTTCALRYLVNAYAYKVLKKKKPTLTEQQLLEESWKLFFSSVDIYEAGIFKIEEPYCLKTTVDLV